MSVAAGSTALESQSIDVANGAPPSRAVSRETVSDEILFEVVGGQVEEKSVGVREIGIATLLVELLAPFARAQRLGRVLMEMVFRLDLAKDLQRRPDVAFVSHAKWPVGRRLPEVSVWDMVPDLAVEVVSPSNSADHVQEKLHEYFRAGVSRVWVVYPRQREVYDYASLTQIRVLQLGEELDGGELIPGFRLPLAALFEDETE